MYRSRIPPWLVLLTPAFVVLLLVVAVPLVLSFYSSFTAFQLTRPETITRWIGTFNYQKAITDWNFWAAFGRTLLLVTLALNLEMLMGLGLALMVSKVTRGQRALRTLMMFPMMFSPILVGFQFKFIFNDNVGLVNNALIWLGLSPVNWLTQEGPAFFAVCLAIIWKSSSFAALVLLILFAPRGILGTLRERGARWIP